MRLEAAIQEFVEYKRALGASYKGENNRLLAFLRSVGDLQLKSLTKKHIDEYLPIPGDKIVTSGWFKKYETLNRFIQFAIGRGYMRHRILPDLLPEKPPAFVPYIYSLEDLRSLLGVPDSHYSPLCPLIPYTMRVFLVLLYGTGLRLGEAIKLNLQDVDLDTAIITVRDTKFFKSRLVPIGGDLLRILRQYRTRQIPMQLQLPDTPFFRTRLGKAVRHDNADHQFQWLRMEAGVLRFDNARFQPRLHDFRHTFAVTRLTSWYREGKNVQRLLPHLSTYLGHMSIEETATYLRMTAELLAEANARFESYSLGRAIMPDHSSLGYWVRRFLLEHLPHERGLSKNTQQSYRDAFRLLLPYVSSQSRVAVDRLTIEDISPEVIQSFLRHLESDRASMTVTRNQRLATIHAFARFVGERCPEHVSWCGHIRLVPFKRHDKGTVPYLEKNEIDAFLAAPDQNTEQGRRDYAVLLFLYNSGARASEAVAVTKESLQFDSTGVGSVKLNGKGRKVRFCPLWKSTMKELESLIRNCAETDNVFRNRYGDPLTRFGVHALVERCVQSASQQAPSLRKKRVSPHTIRHTTATHLLRAGVDINTIRAWLGHVSLETTNIYAETDLSMKAKALAACDIGVRRNLSKRKWREDPGVMAFLQTL